MLQLPGNSAFCFFFIALTSVKALPCESYFPNDSNLCYCNNITIGSDKPVVSVVCQRPSHNSEGSILLSDMKHMTMDHLIITDAAWNKSLEPTGPKKIPKQVCVPDNYKRQKCTTEYTLSYILELPKLRQFRVREMTIRNSVISMSFLKDQEYFEGQANFLTHFTIYNCGMSGVLGREESGEDNCPDLIDISSFDGLPNLEYLDMSYNGIKGIKSSAFEHGFSCLKELNLESNVLKNIEAGSFASLTVLEKLDLSDNQLSDIDSKIFPGVASSLKYLSLRNNVITTIDGNMFKNLLLLKIVDLKQNLIHHIPPELWRSHSLAHFDLSVNFIYCECESIKDVQLEWPRVEGLCKAPVASARLPIAEHFKRCQVLAEEMEAEKATNDSAEMEPSSIPVTNGYDIASLLRSRLPTDIDHPDMKP